MAKVDPKQQVLEEALKNIEKQFGKGAIMRLGK
jgi:RecA/RadA recombinase